MLVRIAFDFAAEDRRALADHMGHAEPLGRDDLEEWARRTIRSTLEVINSEHDTESEES